MLFAIHGEDAPDSLPMRKAARPAHLARVEALVADGRVVLAGPYPALATSEPGSAGFTGSLIVAEFTSLEEARKWAEQDPYLLHGAWQTVSVRPFVQVLP